MRLSLIFFGGETGGGETAGGIRLSLIGSGGKIGGGETWGGMRLNLKDSFVGLSFPSPCSPDEVPVADGVSDDFSGDCGLGFDGCP